MANHKSALKRNRQSQVRRIRNRSIRSRMKGAIKVVHEAVESKAVDTAQGALRAAIQIIQKTAAKGTIHKRNAARKVSRLTKHVNALAKNAQPA